MEANKALEIYEIATGKTLEEAKAAACEKLGVTPDMVTMDVLELPKKTLFGLKTIPAKVKVTLLEEYAKKAAAEEKKQKAAKPEEKKEEKAKEEPAKEKKAPQNEKPKAEKKENREKKEKPKKQPKPEKKEPEVKTVPVSEPAEPETAKKEEPVVVLDPEVVELKGSAAAAYIKDILKVLGYEDASVEYSQRDGSIVLQISGDNMGAVVGRRGDNLDAMQYLASLVANRSEGSYVRVVLDVDDYRSKREVSLRAYARKTAIQVARSGKAITLEAMNPYERRIVHSTVQGVNGATSKSTGSEPNRRVVISPDGERPHQGNRKRGGRGDRKGQNRESQKVTVPVSNEPPKDDTSAISLYGRIDL